MRLYTIKLEDKAAVLNRLKAAKVKIPSFKIHDNKSEGTFSIFIENLEVQSVFEKIINTSPRIDVVNKKDIKEALRKIIRQELLEWKLPPVIPVFTTHAQLAQFLNTNPGRKNLFIDTAAKKLGIDGPPFEDSINDYKLNPITTQTVATGEIIQGRYDNPNDDEVYTALAFEENTSSLVFSLEYFEYPYLYYGEAYKKNNDYYENNPNSVSIQFGPNTIYIAEWLK